MKLFIKHMVCNRCITAVRTELEKHGLTPVSILLGEVELKETSLTPASHKTIDEGLTALGFELIDDRRSKMIEKIKNVVVDMVHYKEEAPAQKHSQLIADALHYDYPYLSKLFSEVEGITIEQYIINQKVEKIKEYIVYDELNLSEIAYMMHYSSVAHLSAQFKKVTGLTPSHFRKSGAGMRKPLDKVGDTTAG